MNSITSLTGAQEAVRGEKSITAANLKLARLQADEKRMRSSDTTRASGSKSWQKKMKNWRNESLSSRRNWMLSVLLLAPFRRCGAGQTILKSAHNDLNHEEKILGPN